ncbi:hypothetical protein ACHAWF_008735 [Thalassiosira exigua]
MSGDPDAVAVDDGRRDDGSTSGPGPSPNASSSHSASTRARAALVEDFGDAAAGGGDGTGDRRGGGGGAGVDDDDDDAAVVDVEFPPSPSSPPPPPPPTPPSAAPQASSSSVPPPSSPSSSPQVPRRVRRGGEEPSPPPRPSPGAPPVESAAPPPGPSSPSNHNPSASSSSSAVAPSFTSDSPYLRSYVDREMRSLVVLTETLRDISARARTFGKCGALMAEATRRLSGACRLNVPGSGSGGGSSGGGGGAGNGGREGGGEGGEGGAEEDEALRLARERRQSVGDEMASVLGVLGEILDEVADAQVSMCQSLEASLSLSLEAFAGVELNEATRLRSEADALGDNAEGTLGRYLHGRHAERAHLAGGRDGGGGGGLGVDALDQRDFVASWNKLSDHVGSQFKGWNRATSAESSGTDGSGGDGSGGGKEGAKEPGRRLKNLRDKMVGNKGGPGGGGSARTGEGDAPDAPPAERDPSLATAEAAANLRHNLEQVRLAQANAELKRFQLLRRLDSIKTRRNFELGESTLASLNGLRAYFHHCSDMIEGLTPKLASLQDQRAKSRERHDRGQVPWDARQKRLTDAVAEVGSSAGRSGAVADALAKGRTADLTEDDLGGHPTTLEGVESATGLWDLPHQLGLGNLYRRRPSAGVVAEGWLYKKSSSRLSLSQWQRRWFVLDGRGVYYLKGSDGDRKGDGGGGGGGNANGGPADDWMERVKVCDILLCTVREINPRASSAGGGGGSSTGLRFCFEIISPNNKAYLLQACGPEDYKMWVSGIRNCIERQLAHGKLPPEASLGGGSRATGNAGPGGGRPRLLPGRNRSRGGRNDLEQLGTEDHRDGVIVQRQNTGSTVDSAGAPPSPASPASGTRNPLVPRILAANPVCADCGNPDPDWASLNLGVVVCIECSGVHRSLGVHVSKVRSLRLDTMTEPEYSLLTELGNERANRIWEAGLHHQKGWSKPPGPAPRKAKEEWIKSKYVWRGFLEYSAADGNGPGDREAALGRDLYNAAKLGDLSGVQGALARGGSVGWRNEEERGRMALHACATGRPQSDEENTSGSWKGTQCAELLIQNGAKLNAEDYDHHKALDCAVVGNGIREMIEYLSARTGPTPGVR